MNFAECLERPTPEVMETNFNSIAESHGTNLCHNYFGMNRKEIRIDEKQDTFLIKSPTIFTISLKTEEYNKYSKMLKEAKQCFTMSFSPKGYGKGQTCDIYDISLDMCYCDNAPYVKVLEFGYSYGKIMVDDIETNISHSGGTKLNSEGWIDYTTNWNIAGDNRIKVLEHLIKILSGDRR